MSPTPAAFPLRFHNSRLRQLVRDVAESEGVSQNELIEQAVEHEVVLRGAMHADDLAAAAVRLAEMSESVRRNAIERSIEEFGAGEGLREPLQAVALHEGSAEVAGQADLVDPLGVSAAFRAASS